MELEFKKDFSEIQNRWDLFWQGRYIDKPLVSMVLPKEGVTPIAKPGCQQLIRREGAFEPVIEQMLKWAETHEFIGEAIPYVSVEFGPDHFSTLLGCDLEFLPDSSGTNWAVPFLKDLDDKEIRFRRDSFWWNRTVSFIREARKACDGKLLLAAPTLVAGLDSLVAMRGVQELNMDLALYPEKVKQSLSMVNKAYIEILDALAIELDYERYGSINRHGMYSRGRIAVPQCDCSTMISPEMFQEFEVPCLEFESDKLDAVEYHLDGPDTIKHLSAICEIDGIDIIQWVPGAGEAEDQDWMDLYREIDSRGKGQIIMTEDHDMLKTMCRDFKSGKLFFKTSAATIAEANEFYNLISYNKK